MDNVVITILQGRVLVNWQTVLGGLTISSSYKFPTVYMCQKLWKLVESSKVIAMKTAVFWPSW